MNSKFNKFLITGIYCLICLVLSAAAFCFGLSRLNLHNARTNPSAEETIKHSISVFPNDADYYELQADLLLEDNEIESAAEAIEKAVKLKPNYYLFFIKLGHLRQLAGRDGEAEAAFRQAVKLAPFYAAPHLFLGNHLIKNSFKQEGFAQLRFAFERQPDYFESVISFAWAQTGGNTDEVYRLLAPWQPDKIASFAEFLIENDSAADLPVLICADPSALTALDREDIVSKLFAKNYFYIAYQINYDVCRMPENSGSAFADGSFENSDIQTGSGFGWRTVNLPDSLALFVDSSVAADGKKSLRITFNGSSNSSLPLLSQTICIAKRRKYQFRIVVKTSEIVTGGIPVIQIILAGKEEKSVVKEIKLPVQNDDEWKIISEDFETGDQTEAVEFRLSRDSCPQSPCPAFGRLWLDNAQLSILY